jgi:cytochrome c biogenesis protein CcmG/thiol:disulfide interchange protein DsbE
MGSRRERVETAQIVPSEESAARGPRRHLLFRLLQFASLVSVAALLALLGWRLVNDSRGSDLVSAVRAGKKPAAPQFRLAVIWRHTETWPRGLVDSLSSGRVSLQNLRGEAVVLNFWASWCIPCKAEAPLLVASARTHAGKVAFLGIDVQDFKSDARRFLRRYHANYVSLRDGGGSTSSGYGLTGVPETYFVDRRGRIVAHVPGQITRDQLEAGVRLLIGGS